MGRCLDIICGVKPGYDLKWCLFIAVIMVDLLGRDTQHGNIVLTPCVFSFSELSPTEMDFLAIYAQEDII